MPSGTYRQVNNQVRRIISTDSDCVIKTGPRVQFPSSRERCSRAKGITNNQDLARPSRLEESWPKVGLVGAWKVIGICAVDG